MERYLVFDSGCSTCTQIAHEIELITQGWLQVRSLREPSTRNLLIEIRPTAKWEPTLLILEGNQRIAFTGLQMRLYLMQHLGLRKTIRIARSIGQIQAELIGVPARRTFLYRAGMTISALAVIAGIPRKISAKFVEPHSPQAQAPMELYKGFILLPEGTPFPDFIEPPAVLPPSGCGMGEQSVDQPPIYFSFGSVTELATTMKIPVATLDDTLQKMLSLEFASAALNTSKSGDLYSGVITFRYYSPAAPSGYTTISLETKPVFYSPYPIWHEPKMVPVVKADYLPGGGLAQKHTEMNGLSLYFFADGVLYAVHTTDIPDLTLESLASHVTLVAA